MDPSTIQNTISPMTPEGLNTPPQAAEKPKNHKAIIWVLSILTIIALTAASVFAYLYFTKDTTDTVESTDIEEPIKNNDESSLPTAQEISTLLKEKYNFSEKERAFCIGAHDIKCSINNFDEDKKIQFTIFHAPDDLFGEKRYADGYSFYTQNIKYDDINSVFQDYFGSSENIAKEDHVFEESFLIQMEYLPESDSFDVQFRDGLGGTTSIDIFNKVIDTQKTTDGFLATVISVTIDNVVRSEEEPFFGYFGDKQVYQMSISLEDINAIQESLSAYHFYFIDDNGEYKLTSIEKL
ncbi:hypothetical protein IKF43_02515 [Candidatus Saccharibacteria bacterium]|nr:hypothetical protein [Candidatus Saccharibacteria bacterium]